MKDIKEIMGQKRSKTETYINGLENQGIFAKTTQKDWLSNSAMRGSWEAFTACDLYRHTGLLLSLP